VLLLQVVEQQLHGMGGAECEVSWVVSAQQAFRMESAVDVVKSTLTR
jgi:hypothetical protein